MLSLALCASAVSGAARHYPPLAQELVRRGHRVTVLTAPEARADYDRLGVEVVAVPELKTAMQVDNSTCKRGRAAAAGSW